MKTWNAPVVEELKIAETANGFVDFVYEEEPEWLFNDELAKRPENKASGK